MKRPLFTSDDAKIAFNLFCGVFGIGTLGMPANYSRAGPVLGTIALVFMASANVYASVVTSKALLVAPKSVKTFGDLGEWSMGKTGRVLVMVSQMLALLLSSTAFLVLGGMLLDSLFPDGFDQQVWIVLMTVAVLPFCLTPTLKEGAGAAFAGCVGTILADVISVGVILHGMRGHPAIPAPKIRFDQVVTTFGNLALAYGAACIIPSLQLEHKDPKRMPYVVCVTMTAVSVLFLALTIFGYIAVGCQIDGNLLFSIVADPVTKLTPLGFASNRGMVILAYLGMQVHISIAFAVLLHPVFFVLERIVLGMHQDNTPAQDLEASIDSSLEANTNDLVKSPTTDTPTGNHVEMMELRQKEEQSEEDTAEYKSPTVIVKYIMLRMLLVVVLVVVAIVLKDHFLELVDFVGASAVTLSCIILPILFYLKSCWRDVSYPEKAVSVLIVVVCAFLGVYVSIQRGKDLFAPAKKGPDTPKFPFCEPEYQFDLYYNASNQTSWH